LANFDLGEHFQDGPESNDFYLLEIVIKKIEWRNDWMSKIKTYEPE